MAKTSLVLISMLLFVVAAPAYAWLVDYQDPNGSHDLGIAGDWFRITNANDPNSRSGVTGLPTTSDNTMIRTGSNALFLNGTTIGGGGGGTGYFAIGGPSLIANPPSTVTEVTVQSGAEIDVWCPNDSSAGNNLSIGNTYDGTLTVDGGTVKALSADGSTGGTIYLSKSASGKVGTLNVKAGEVTFGKMVLGWVGGVGIVNQTGGTVKNLGGATLWVGYANSTGRGEYNLSDGLLFIDSSTSITIGWRGAGNKSLFNQTGGSFYNAGTLRVVRNDQTTGVTDAEYELLGGRLTTGSLQMAANASDLYEKAKFKVNQDGELDCAGSFTSNSTQNTIEMIVGSASDFKMKVGGNVDWGTHIPTMQVKVAGVYTPTPYQTWKLVDLTTGAVTLPGGGSFYEWYQCGNPDPNDLEPNLPNYGYPGGWGMYKDTGNNDIILYYVPEPATLTLLGLGGLALLRRRRS